MHHIAGTTCTPSGIAKSTRRRPRLRSLPHPYRYWTAVILPGLTGLIWLLFRSGTKPSRLSYPCQQAALGAANMAFGAPVVMAALALRRRASAARPKGVAGAGTLVAAAMIGLLAVWAWSPPALTGPLTGADAPPAPDTSATLYVIDDARGPAGRRFGGVDDLVLWMGADGLPFYRSDVTRHFECGPEGLIARDDVVVIKINYQWEERGGTNVDVLRGLISRIVEHPDGFAGEIVVCENAQFVSVANFDRALNNAENPALSPHDVVVEFQELGWRISHFDWTAVRNLSVNEYSAGDLRDGYVVNAYDPTLGGRVSYPKFRTALGTYVSVKLGLWDAGAGQYDRGRLRFINVPVLKSHHASYGVTACTKNYMGVVTGALSTNSHSAIANGVLGALLGEIRLADLNVLDCIWINANPYTGPSTSYSGATRTDKLVAGIDPIAIDIWATKNILTPAFVRNGYPPPWPHPSADPDDPSSAFRIYLDRSMARILSAGYNVTNDLGRITARRWDGDPGVRGDINADGTCDGGDISAFVETITGAVALPVRLIRCDLDGDLDVDGDDAAEFVDVLIGV